MKIELTERSIDIIGKTLDCALKEGKISMEEYEVVLDNVNANASTPKAEESKAYVCSCADGAHLSEKEDLSKLTPVGWYSVHTKGKVVPFKESPTDEPLLNITQVKELLDNLELSGFSHSEAMAIVLKVVGRG